MTESEFTRKVNTILTERGVYCEKMFNPMRGGTPDCWYSAKNCPDIWVEFKYLKAVPVRGRDVGCSELQKRWLKARYEEGRKVFVLVGTPKGSRLFSAATLFAQSWKAGPNDFDFERNVPRLAAKQIADVIFKDDDTYLWR